MRFSYPKGQTEIERFEWIGWDVTADGCHEWKGRTDKHGYGLFSFITGTVLAHRTAYRLYVGELTHMPIHHACANSLCVNPDHLAPVTQAANMAEMLGRRALEAQIAELSARLSALEG